MKVYELDRYEDVTINGSPIMFLSGLDREAIRLTETLLHVAKSTGLNKFNVDLELITKKIKKEEKYMEILHDINSSCVLCFGAVVGLRQAVNQIGTYDNSRCIYVELNEDVVNCLDRVGWDINPLTSTQKCGRI